MVIKSRQPAPIFGREHEQARLRELLDQAIAGQGSLVLVSGEAGIGKTTLVNDLARQAEADGVLVLSGGCYDLMTTPPYGPWVTMFSRFWRSADQPAFPTWIDTEHNVNQPINREQVFSETARFFNKLTHAQPAVAILEDLHWSDTASIDLLRYLSRELDTGLLIVATYREDDLARESPLYRLLPVLVRESDAQHIRLERLDKRAIQAIVSTVFEVDTADLAALTDFALRKTEGNPLFIVELLRSLAESRRELIEGEGAVSSAELDATGIPPLILLVIQRRLDTLDAQTRDVLQIASVIGQDIPVGLWRTVCSFGEAGAFEQAVRQALEARIIEELPGQERYQFTHALVRDAIYDDMLLPRRQILHREIAEQLLELPRADPDIVAHHLQLAGDDRVVEWLLRAALRARATAAWVTAVERIIRAADLLEGNQTYASERGWLYYYAAYLSRYSNTPKTIKGLFDQAHAIAVHTGDYELTARVRAQRGVMRCIWGEIRLGIADLEQALADFDQLNLLHPAQSADIKGPEVIRTMISDPDTIHELIRFQVSDSDSSRESYAFLPGLNVYTTWLAYVGRVQEALSLGEELRAAMDLISPGSEAIFRCEQDLEMALGTAYAIMGRPENARSHYRCCRRIVIPIGDYTMASFTLQNEFAFVMLPFHPNRIGERTHFAIRIEEFLSRAGKLMATGIKDSDSFSRVFLELLEGRWENAVYMGKRLEHATPYLPFLESPIAFALGTVDRHRGDPASAWQRVLTWLPEGAATEPGDSPWIHSRWLQQLAVDLALDDGDLESAREWLDASDRWLDWNGAVLTSAERHLGWARFHRLAGDIDQARRQAEKAFARASNPRQPLVLISVHRVLGQLDHDEGLYDNAGKHFSAAFDLATTCQARLEQALTQLAMAELAVTERKPEEARQLLKDARSICEPLQARRVLNIADEIETRIVGAAGQNPAGLTAREAEVLRLVAEGLTNPQVAGELHISPRTVDRHVSSIFNKLNVSTRAAATRFAVENDLI